MKEESTLKSELITAETKRLSDKYGKSFLNTKDIMEITGLGRDNVRSMIKSKAFPVTKAGSRKIVSITAFVNWQFSQSKEG